MMLRIAATAVATLLLSSCATMFNGGPTNFTATSEPSGATVFVSSVNTAESMEFTTPADFTLDKSYDYNLRFELAGYQSETITVRRTTSEWVIGSVLLGVLPIVVDIATDSMQRHTMSVAHVDFTQASATDGTIEGRARLGITRSDGEVDWVDVPLLFEPI